MLTLAWLENIRLGEKCLTVSNTWANYTAVLKEQRQTAALKINKNGKGDTKAPPLLAILPERPQKKFL
jgi:hypothetical protein